VIRTKVADVMTSGVMSCLALATLNDAAHVMWEHDCGWVPVVDHEARVIGVVTDRDIAMASYTQGRALFDIPIHSVSSKKIISCEADDTISLALKRMRDAKIHRMPVVDSAGRLVGLVSLSDVARAIEIDSGSARANPAIELAETVATIRKPRPPVPVVALAGGAQDGTVKPELAKKRAPRKKKDPSTRPAKT
jgi:CBS-domain-containing membrane protein